ncbi:hypothetical protein B0H14DRAFT_2563862 [Mycena olivaceomarginata]|nr:hypothetical protein B0H14DRAFT_2563862 [Mycena olivaceomarginata]
MSGFSFGPSASGTSGFTQVTECQSFFEFAEVERLKWSTSKVWTSPIDLKSPGIPQNWMIPQAFYGPGFNPWMANFSAPYHFHGPSPPAGPYHNQWNSGFNPPYPFMSPQFAPPAYPPPLVPVPPISGPSVPPSNGMFDTPSIDICYLYSVELELTWLAWLSELNHSGGVHISLAITYLYTSADTSVVLFQTEVATNT